MNNRVNRNSGLNDLTRKHLSFTEEQYLIDNLRSIENRRRQQMDPGLEDIGLKIAFWVFILPGLAMLLYAVVAAFVS